MNAAKPQPSTTSYPLSTLFLLITVFATLIAQLGLLRSTSAIEFLSPTVFAGATIGPIFGLIIGVCDYRRKRGASYGIITGFFVGLLAAPVALGASVSPLRALITALASAALLIGFAAIYARQTGQDPVTTGCDFSKLPRTSTSPFATPQPHSALAPAADHNDSSPG